MEGEWEVEVMTPPGESAFFHLMRLYLTKLSDRFDSEIEANMREYVRRLNARCRGEPIEENEEPSTSPAPLEEAEEDDNSSVVHEGPGGGDLPPGAPGDMSRVSGLQRRNSLKVMRALEGGEDDDDKEYGGPLPKLSARISNMR